MFIRNAAANLREKDDHWNPALGGFVAGAILGTRCMRPSHYHHHHHNHHRDDEKLPNRCS